MDNYKLGIQGSTVFSVGTTKRLLYYNSILGVST